MSCVHEQWQEWSTEQPGQVICKQTQVSKIIAKLPQVAFLVWNPSQPYPGIRNKDDMIILEKKSGPNNQNVQQFAKMEPPTSP